MGKCLLVCSVLSAVSADPQVFLGGLHGYPYSLGSALTYTPHVIKPVVKEIEIPVKTVTYGIKETGCKNSFGFSPWPMAMVLVPMAMASPTPMLLLLSLLLSQRLPRWRFPSTSTRLSTRRWSWLLFVTMAWDLLFLVLKNIAEAE